MNDPSSSYISLDLRGELACLVHPSSPSSSPSPPPRRQTSPYSLSARTRDGRATVEGKNRRRTELNERNRPSFKQTGPRRTGRTANEERKRRVELKPDPRQVRAFRAEQLLHHSDNVISATSIACCRAEAPPFRALSERRRHPQSRWKGD